MMCRNYDAGECVEDGCAGRITCHDFTDQRCVEHSYNGRWLWFLDEDDAVGERVTEPVAAHPDDLEPS